jgi:predicted RND superfamily exporter protein
MMGIAAADVFLLYDAWMQEGEKHHKNPEIRLSKALNRAIRSMCLTSMTTFMVLVSNFFCPLVPIQTFGIHASIIVIMNYISVCVYFPCHVLLVHKVNNYGFKSIFYEFGCNKDGEEKN